MKFMQKFFTLILFASVALGASAKEFTTTLANEIEVTYLVNTSDKIARVKKVEEVGPNSATKVTVPKTVKYKEGSKTYTLTVIGISAEAFAHTWIEEVKLPSTIKSIGKSAFDHSSVKKINMPESLETIGEGAFMNSWIEGVLSIPAGCTSIGKNAFTGTAITSVNFHDSGISAPLAIGEYAFSVSRLQSVALNRVASLGEGVFSLCDELRSLNISGNVTAIPRTLCYGCKSLVQLGIPVVSSIGEMAFANCESLKEFPFMPGLKTIGDSSFMNTGLTTAYIKDGCETIMEEAFFDCSDLKTVDFPASLKSIGNAAFQRCYNLNSVSCSAIAPPVMNHTAFQVYRPVDIWVPKNSIPAYENANGWRYFDYSALKGSGIDAPEAVDNAPEILCFDLQGNPIPAGNDYNGVYVEIKDGKSSLKINR